MLFEPSKRRSVTFSSRVFPIERYPRSYADYISKCTTTKNIQAVSRYKVDIVETYTENKLRICYCQSKKDTPIGSPKGPRAIASLSAGTSSVTFCSPVYVVHLDRLHIAFLYLYMVQSSTCHICPLGYIYSKEQAFNRLHQGSQPAITEQQLRNPVGGRLGR